MIGRLKNLLGFIWKYFLGAVFCAVLPGSVLVVGWSYRLVRRYVIREWWKLSTRSSATGFAEFLSDNSLQQEKQVFPNWLLQHRATKDKDAPRSLRTLVRPFAQSLAINFKHGVQGVFNTWVLTMPGCMLWLFAWYAGWDNSFNKGYEQFWVGPLTGWIGVLLFIAAMFYVPMAQARQAATGNWKSFYQFRLVRECVRQQWFGCLILAGLYSAASLPVTLLRSAPVIMEKMFPSTETMSDAELYQFLQNYYFYSCLIVFPVFVFLRLAAGRIYSTALVAAVQRSPEFEEHLDELEKAVLGQLGLLKRDEQDESNPIFRAIGWMGKRTARTTGGFVAFLIWFSFVAQLFVAEFLVYHPVVGWLNQPLVQLPYFNHIPQHLKESASKPPQENE